MQSFIPWKKPLPIRRTDGDFFTFSPFSPFSDLYRVLDNCEPLSERLESEFMPSIDMHETDKEVEISAELPGITSKDIDLSISENTLVIKGEKSEEKEEGKKGTRIVECRYGCFTRSIPLPQYLDTTHVDASYKNGVLRVKLPKTAEYQKNTSSIPIKSEQ